MLPKVKSSYKLSFSILFMVFGYVMRCYAFVLVFIEVFRHLTKAFWIQSLQLGITLCLRMKYKMLLGKRIYGIIQICYKIVSYRKIHHSYNQAPTLCLMS